MTSRAGAALIILTLVACQRPEPPHVPEVVEPVQERFEPLPEPASRLRAPGEFEIVAVYRYPGTFEGMFGQTIVALDIDVSSRADIDLGALEMTDADHGVTHSAFVIYRLNGDGERVGLHDPAYAYSSRYFAAFVMDAPPDFVRLGYWGMPLGEGIFGVEASGLEHPEERLRVLARTSEEPADWFQTHRLLIAIENGSRSSVPRVPIGCDGRISRLIELDGDARWESLERRPSIVPERRFLIEQRCWSSQGHLPPEVAFDAEPLSLGLYHLPDDLPVGALVLDGHWGVVRSLSFSRDGTRIAVASNAKVAVWDLEGPNRIVDFEAPSTVTQVLLSPDGTRLVAASPDHAPTLWDMESGERVRELLMTGTPNADSEVRMSPSGQLFGVDSQMGTDRAITVWGTRAGAPALRLGPGDFETWSFSDDGFGVLTCDLEGQAQTWDMSDGSRAAAEHRCPLAVEPLDSVPAGDALRFLLAEPLAAETATASADGSRVAFGLGPDADGADRVVVLGL
ncbi:MAG: hypothetical protein ACJAYU_001309 [Bradymonadia bacterium]|jgi:hypothetical protein